MPKDTSMKQENGVMVGGAMMVPSKDIVDNAVESKDHTTLVAAVKAAGLVETLKGNGPFTVFAPTDLAFGKLREDEITELLKPENRIKLTGILNNLVVEGRNNFKDFADGQRLKALNGKELVVHAAMVWYC